jgi:hypothetical protein
MNKVYLNFDGIACFEFRHILPCAQLRGLKKYFVLRQTLFETCSSRSPRMVSGQSGLGFVRDVLTFLFRDLFVATLSRRSQFIRATMGCLLPDDGVSVMCRCLSVPVGVGMLSVYCCLLQTRTFSVSTSIVR